MTSWNPGDQQPGQPGQQPGYGQQPPSYGQQPPAPNFDKGGQPPAPPAYGQSAPPPPAYGQQQPAYGGGYGAPPQNQYGNNPYGSPQGGGLPGGATGPLNMGNRVVAYLIDAIIPVVLVVVIVIVQVVLIAGAAVSTANDCSDFSVDPNTGAVSGGCDPSAGTGVGIGVLLLSGFLYLLLLAFAIYQIYLTGSRGQTIGKKFMGVKVVDNDSGQTIGFGRAFLRLIVQGLSNIVCYAGLWSAWLDGPPEGRYRGWHDKAVNTVVISVK